MVAKETGWSKEEIIYNTSFAALQLMIADAPKTSYSKKGKEEFESDEDLANWLGAE
ncbi:hypothetical protein HX001_17070 [Empedobacter brevis]|uniref:Uncharacterized protein n=2 Tax=Empedobacter brevis TaxID=247 RepID=A0AAJ1QHP2_9FLAO|nr:hypothetical protein [Empedobacter brevis]